MTMWHYLGLFLIGAIVTWSGAARCARQKRWTWAAAGLVPFAAGVVWVFVVWLQLDWESGFFDQHAWLLAVEFGLLAFVWLAGLAAWAVSLRTSPAEQARTSPTPREPVAPREGGSS